MAVVLGHLALGRGLLPELFQAPLCAETAVRQPFFHQQLCVLLVKGHPLGLDIGPHWAAHIGAFVIVQIAALHGAFDDRHRILHLPLLVGVFDPKDKLTLIVPGDQIGVQGGAQIAHMHITGGRGRKTGAHFPSGDALLHLLKPLIIKCHSDLPPHASYGVILFFSV